MMLVFWIPSATLLKYPSTEITVRLCGWGTKEGYDNNITGPIGWGNKNKIKHKKNKK